MTGLPRTFKVRVHMLSDWAVGTGEGRVGDIDATVRRDADGLPFVPAKTLTGIWRDACEQVASWIGGAGEDGNPWLEWVDWLFGSQPDREGDRAARAHRGPQPATLALSPARLSGSVRDACRNRPALRAAAVLLRPGVALDTVTGVARDDMLRLEERARPAILEAEAEFPGLDCDHAPRPAELLLRAGAAAVDALGGKRNRGSGRCWLLLPGGNSPDNGHGQASPAVVVAPASATPRPPDERLAELAADAVLLDSPGPPPTRVRPPVLLAVPAGPVPDHGHDRATRERVVHRVTLRVITPLVAQQRVLGNVTLSLDSVPGSILLPGILARLSGPRGPRERTGPDDAGPRAGHRDLVVGDARPAVPGSAGTALASPAPMTWHRPKQRHRTDVVNAAERRPAPAERRQPMRSGHIVPAGPGTWQLLAPVMSVSTHAVIDDDAGRPTQDRGGVFTYLGLAPGTVLASDIVLPAGVRLRLARGDRLRLGRSRKDDFGHVLVEDVREVPMPEVPGAAAGDLLRVWCVSDVLLRDPSGAADPTPAALAAELSHLLGAPAEAVTQDPGGPVASAFRAARRESFHSRWGRPRPSLLGLAAGSVVTVRLGADVPGQRLAGVQRDGLGERTVEGFGQVRFNAAEVTIAEPVLIRDPVVTRPATWTFPDRGTASDWLPEVPDPLERAAVTAEIARQVARLAASGIDTIVPGASQVSSRAQWGALRQQVDRLTTPGGREAVARWFASSRAVRQRRAIWGQAALDRLEQLITEEDCVWSALGLDGPALDPFVLAPGRAPEVRRSLRLTAVASLISEISRDATLTLQAPAAAGKGRP